MMTRVISPMTQAPLRNVSYVSWDQQPYDSGTPPYVSIYFTSPYVHCWGPDRRDLQSWELLDEDPVPPLSTLGGHFSTGDKGMSWMMKEYDRP